MSVDDWAVMREGKSRRRKVVRRASMVVVGEVSRSGSGVRMLVSMMDERRVRGWEVPRAAGSDDENAMFRMNRI
jgi:hypothetical protein